MVRIGDFICCAEDIILNEGLKTEEVVVTNTGDRAIQVGSHYHFFECNHALQFERKRSFGMHLDIPAGTAIRFEPGEERKVQLCAYRGTHTMRGFNNLTNGCVDEHRIREHAFRRAQEKGFLTGDERLWQNE